jgi:uncharacterized membrane protein YhfC
MDSLFVTHLLNGLLMVGMPVGLVIYLTRRFRLGWRLWWIGAATFVLSQVGHIPFNALLTRLFQTGILPQPPAAWLPYFNPVVLGLSSGLFEELSRAAMYAWWAKDARSWRRGVLLGAGFGGAEAILLGALVLYAFLQMSALRNTDLSTIFPANQLQLAQQQVHAYWSASWTASLLGAVERLFTIPTQICLSVIVLQAFTRRQPGWVALAVLWHAILDGVSVYLAGLWQGQPWAAYVIEGVVGLMAVISVVFLFALRRPEPEPEPILSPPVPEPIPLQSIQPVTMNQEINPEALDKSKYL